MQSVGRQIFTKEMDMLEAHFVPSPQLKNLIVLSFVLSNWLQNSKVCFDHFFMIQQMTLFSICKARFLNFADVGLFHPPNNCEMYNIIILILQIGKKYESQSNWVTYSNIKPCQSQIQELTPDNLMSFMPNHYTIHSLMTTENIS